MTSEEDFTIVDEKSGEEFESLEEAKKHRRERQREETMEEVKEILSEHYSISVEEIEDTHGLSFETIVERAMAHTSLSSDVYSTPSRVISGCVLQQVGFYLLNGRGMEEVEEDETVETEEEGEMGVEEIPAKHRRYTSAEQGMR